jgi:hypothetical protein
MATLPIPNPFGNVSTQKIKSSWINNLQANTYVAPYGLMFFDTYDGVLRLGDGETQGGRIIGTGGGGNGAHSHHYPMPHAHHALFQQRQPCHKASEA